MASFVATHAFAITTANTDLAVPPTRLYVGTTGDLVVILYKDSAPITFKSVPAGTLFDMKVKQVLTTSTANSIVGLY